MISYQTEGIDMPAIKKRETTAWIKAVADTYGKKVGEIAYIFCSDEKILEVNRQVLSVYLCPLNLSDTLLPVVRSVNVLLRLKRGERFQRFSTWRFTSKIFSSEQKMYAISPTFLP